MFVDIFDIYFHELKLNKQFFCLFVCFYMKSKDIWRILLIVCLTDLYSLGPLNYFKHVLFVL